LDVNFEKSYQTDLVKRGNLALRAHRNLLN